MKWPGTFLIQAIVSLERVTREHCTNQQWENLTQNLVDEMLLVYRSVRGPSSSMHDHFKMSKSRWAIATLPLLLHLDFWRRTSLLTNTCCCSLDMDEDCFVGGYGMRFFLYHGFGAFWWFCRRLIPLDVIIWLAVCRLGRLFEAMHVCSSIVNSPM